jgi:hypothetical protein
MLRIILEPMRLRNRCLSLFLVLVASASLTLSQLPTATILGVVKDSSGAVVPEANVTARNLETGQTRVALTAADGSYRMSALPVGNYELRVEHAGFQSSVRSGLNLTVGSEAVVHFTMEVGSVEETVEVTAEAPLVNTTSGSLGGLVDEQRMADLPLNGRNFTQLTTLSPGVTRGTPGSAANSATNVETFRYGEFGGTAISVNGLREQFNNFMIEGLDNNETLVNSIAYVPSPETIKEFTLITTTAPAEFGRAGGAIQNMVIKDGTNDFHGSAYYFDRPKSLAATPKFAQTKPDFNNRDFGATLGGPIIKDRTFFFGSYHGLRNSIPVEAGN